MIPNFSVEGKLMIGKKYDAYEVSDLSCLEYYYFLLNGLLLWCCILLGCKD